MSDTVLGIDLGTSSVKVVLTDRVGKVLRASTHEYPVLRPHPGWAETEPEAWWSAIVAGVHAVLEGLDPRQVRGIGLSGQMHGVVLVDGRGEVVRPAVLWADARADLATYDRLPAATRARLANPVSPGTAGPILEWLCLREPGSIDRARFALCPKDWVRGRLTGSWATEPSDASATLLYDVISQDWSAEVLAALGVPTRLLPPILAHSGVPAGRLRVEVAGQLGMPADLPVAAGAGDTPAAALGSGLLNPGQAQLTIGTGVQIVAPVEAPSSSHLQPATSIVTHLYRDATPHGWYAMAAGLTGGTTLAWVTRMLAADWQALYAAASHRPQEDDPLFLPHLMGERTPYLDTAMRGAWLGLDARHDREALLYSALEGVAFAVADGLDAMPRSAVANGSLWLAGGGTTSEPWRALLADVLKVELRAVEVPGASARGAALLGAIAAGLIEQDDLTTLTRPSTALAASPTPNPVLDARRERYRTAVAMLRHGISSQGATHASRTS